MKLLVLAGDGIGPEVMAQAVRVAEAICPDEGLTIEHGLVGGAAIDAHGMPLHPDTLAQAHAADAVLLGAVGGPKWAGVPFDSRPEAGLLALRKELGLFANLRPASLFPALTHASSLKPEIIQGLDLMIVRELTGGVYFGQPKVIRDLPNGEQEAVDTQIYSTHEIERIARVAFELARGRRNYVVSAEKANVMLTGKLWREVVTRLHAAEYPDVRLEHHLADSLAMQLVRAPCQFDVILSDNLFGDILSDQAAMLTGSIGMLPSASLGAVRPDGKRPALYEPVHGSAPDIAGQDVANPLAAILSLAMALRWSFGRVTLAERIEQAVSRILAQGSRSADIARPGEARIGCRAMGDAVLAALQD